MEKQKRVTSQQIHTLNFIFRLYWFCSNPKCGFHNHPLHTNCIKCGQNKFAEIK